MNSWSWNGINTGTTATWTIHVSFGGYAPPPPPPPPPAQQLNPYDILGIPRGSSPADCRRAYRRLARQIHPDVGGDEERMKLVNMAFTFLKERKLA